MYHPRRTREEWRAHVAAWKRSDLSGDDYAHKHGINANTFAWWRSQLGRERPAQPKLTLVPVTVQPQQPVRAPLEVALPDGIVVRVADHADPVVVARLVRALLPAC